MSLNSYLPSMLRGLHMLSVCAWLGGGLGVLLLLFLGKQTESSDELQAYNLVITAIDDLLISPGAFGTIATGVLLSHARKKTLLRNHWLVAKLSITLAAMFFGGFFLAPWLKGMLSVAVKDGFAVFDDLAYLNAYRTGMAGSLLQMFVLLGILWGSVTNRLASRQERKCGCCPLLTAADDNFHVAQYSYAVDKQPPAAQ
jgi:uncharacterized membrane protein